uniref:non-canonical purine NTP pyrophosphatase n=1 Tax=Clavibacter michiganensis TaxID=28447 RepID=UPI00292F8395
VLAVPLHDRADAHVADCRAIVELQDTHLEERLEYLMCGRTHGDGARHEVGQARVRGRTARGARAESPLRQRGREGALGHDPIYRPDTGGASAADLSADDKNRVSHRALADDAIMPVVRNELLGEA